MRLARFRWPNGRLLWLLVRPHRWALGAGVALGLASTATSLATPLATKYVLDGLTTAAPFAPWLALLVTLLVLGTALGFAQRALLGRLAESVVLDARSTLVRRMLRLRMGEVAAHSDGGLVARVTSDTVLLREASTAVVPLLNGLAGLVGALVLMAVLDMVLLVSMITAVLVVAGVFALLMPRVARAYAAAQESVGSMGGLLESALRAIRTVKASRAEDREGERIVRMAREARRHSVRAVTLDALSWVLTGVGMQLSILLILAVGALRVSAGTLAVSSLVAFLLYAFQLMTPVTTLSSTVSQLQAGVAAAGRIREVESLPAERTAPSGRAVVPERVPGVALSFRGVTVRYGAAGTPALTGVDADIAAVGHTAIVGPSGSGKTTMLSLILGFVAPERGEVRLDGLPLDAHPLAEIRRRIAYVEQDTPLVAGTVRDNLCLTRPDTSDAELWDALRATRLDDRVRGLRDGLDTRVTDGTVSGGERQRIALSRALLGMPEILLLDEATAQLDGLSEAAVQEAIRTVAANRAVVTIAHRLSTVVDADRILLMEGGTVRAAGTHTELLSTDGLYHDLVLALRIAAEPGPVPAGRGSSHAVAAVHATGARGLADV